MCVSARQQPVAELHLFLSTVIDRLCFANGALAGCRDDKLQFTSCLSSEDPDPNNDCARNVGAAQPPAIRILAIAIGKKGRLMWGLRISRQSPPRPIPIPSSLEPFRPPPRLVLRSKRESGRVRSTKQGEAQIGEGVPDWFRSSHVSFHRIANFWRSNPNPCISGRVFLATVYTTDTLQDFDILASSAKDDFPRCRWL
jgi:hypothetical protein